MPNAERGALGGILELKESPKTGWMLRIQPQDKIVVAKRGEPIEFPKKLHREKQDWLKFPVGGITYADAQAYVGWLQTSGRLPGARLCSEAEWERAARGADDREYPHGDEITGEDANYDANYQKTPGALGPDAVGSHPLGASPFQVFDLAGNHFEMTSSSLGTGELVGRGGSYYFDALTARSANRIVFPETLRGNDITLRICASWPVNK
jgi:formylglycine-generating enzyme required for sulfatase activity